MEVHPPCRTAIGFIRKRREGTDPGQLRRPTRTRRCLLPPLDDHTHPLRSHLHHAHGPTRRRRSTLAEPTPSSGYYPGNVDPLSPECFPSNRPYGAPSLSSCAVEARTVCIASAVRTVVVVNSTRRRSRGRSKRSAMKITGTNGCRASPVVHTQVALGIIISTSRCNRKRAR